MIGNIGSSSQTASSIERGHARKEESKMRFKFLLMTMAVLFLATQVFASEKKVTLATLEWEPYVGSAMSSHGFTGEIVVEAFKKAGYEVELEFYQWDEALKLAQIGRVDGIFPAYYDKAREEFFLFSDPFAESPVGLFKKSSLPTGPPVAYEVGARYITYSVDPRIDQTEALKGLKEYKIGVVKGYVNTPEFDAAEFLQKEQAPSDEANLRKLFKDEVQLIFIDKYVANYLIAKKFPWYLNEFELMEPPLQIKPLHVAFSKKAEDHEQKLKVFNAGLSLMKKDGMLKRIEARYGF
jgi:ABC-type amino acid transport substrate-binding protein